MINILNSDNPKQKIRSALSANNFSVKKPKPKFKFNPKMIFSGLLLIMLIVGGAVGLYLTQTNQDTRQQASGDEYTCPANTGYYRDAVSCGIACAGTCTGAGNNCCPDTTTPTPTPTSSSEYECNSNNPSACNGNPSACHCTGGDACTGTECNYTIKQSCINQGRSYCTNWQGFGMTCCVEGYVCHSSGLGCAPGSSTPNPTRTPGPTRPPNNTPTPTPPLHSTPTPTTPIGPQCHEITAFIITNGQSTPLTGNADDDLIPGSSTVRFVCAANSTPLESRYSFAFRIWEPCATEPVELFPDLTPNGIIAPSPNAVNYSIDLVGDYAAQCAVCNSITDVCDWEAFTPTACN